MKFFVKVETATNEAKFSGCNVGQRYITGCADNRADAERIFGFGNYSAVYAESSHDVRAATERAGFLK